MIAIVRRILPVSMAFETGRSSIAKTHSSVFGCRAEYHLASKMNGIEQRTYEDAILALNGLQSNADTVKKSINEGPMQYRQHAEETELYLHRIGISMNDLDRLSVIHVAGTKGKGSTCALVESILRNLNIKTGFYSSPHLLNVTERIRLNGEPISKSKFTQYFWKIYNTLDSKKLHTNDMPAYFKFLTVMAFYIFLKEKVDVAVIEVGIGGEYDCTNVVRNTQTVGITSLGLEHTQLLGDTYQEIAWQKSGIIKTGSSVFSTHQNAECIPVLLARAQEKNANFQLVPNFSDYKYHDEKLLNKIALNPTKLRNTSLAIQLSYDWIRKNPEKIANKSICKHLNSSDGGLTLPKEIADALLNCYWPGRCQILIYRNITLYIDGAHTVDSLKLCVDWFNSQTQFKNQKKILIFNSTGDRNPKEMLNLINRNIEFHDALFTPNISSQSIQTKDNTFRFVQPDRSLENSKCWKELPNTNKTQAFTCIADLFKYLRNNYGGEEISVLVTGSLHLVGEVLRTLRE